MNIRAKKNLTVKEVAKLLNVSIATISNAFNRPDQLSKAKRAEILEACKKIGYNGPNRAAQILRKGHSNIIALVLADSVEFIVSDPVASSFIRGVSQELSNQNKHMLLFAGNAKTLLDIADFVDGFICYGAPMNPDIIAELATVKKPVVTVDFNIKGRPSVNIDNEGAAYELVKNTVKPQETVAILGLRLIESPVTCRIYDSPLLLSEHSVSHRRLDGYLRALKELGNEVENDRIWHVPKSSASYARQAAKEVLSSRPRPKTVLCMSDIIALEVLKCALDEGLSIPEDLKITGFDGIDEGARVRPNLTTICQSSIEKGQRAAHSLLSGSTNSEFVDYEFKRGNTAV